MIELHCPFCNKKFDSIEDYKKHREDFKNLRARRLWKNPVIEALARDLIDQNPPGEIKEDRKKLREKAERDLK